MIVVMMVIVVVILMVIMMLMMVVILMMVILMMISMIKVALVVDGQLVGEKDFKKEEIFFRQDSRFNIS